MLDAYSRPDYHLFVSGSTRAGKSVYVERMLRECDRFVALDRKRDYVGLEHATVVESAPEAIDYIRRHESGPLRLVVLTPELAHHLAVMRFVWTLHSTKELPNTLLVVEEAKHFSRGPRSFVQEPEELALSSSGTTYQELLYTEALFYGVMLCTVTQFPQQVATTARNASDWKVTFRYTGGLPDDMRAAFGDYSDTLPGLERLEPGVDPRKANESESSESPGHYLTYPRDLEPLEEVPPLFTP